MDRQQGESCVFGLIFFAFWQNMISKLTASYFGGTSVVIHSPKIPGVSREMEQLIISSRTRV